MSKKYKPLLYLANYPPCDLGGACIIMKQVFSRYDQRKLSVLCDEGWLAAAKGKAGGGGLLPCRHESVPCRLKADLRPRRIFMRVRSILNAFRSEQIFQRAQHIVERENVKALVVPLYNVEFALAGYRLHKLYNIPFYVWECDDWEAISSEAFYVKPLVRRLHPVMLREAERAWMTSPKMIRNNEERFGVKGDFLFNFVDVEKFGKSAPSRQVDTLCRIVYTGAINGMFSDTLQRICGWVNEGIQIGGRLVRLEIYTNCDTRAFVGLHVTDMGFVAHDEIPNVLAQADALLVAVSFDGSQEIVEMTKTSLFTKTIEYLASEKPILYVGPDYTAEHDYFQSVMENVTLLSRDGFVKGLEAVLLDKTRRDFLVTAGRNFVRERHSLEALGRDILSHFKEAGL